VEERSQLRNHAHENPHLSHVDLIAWVLTTFGKKVGRSTVSKIKNQPIQMVHNSDQVKMRQGKFPDMEAKLYEFVLMHQNDAVLSDELLHTKANNILEHLHPDCTVSLSWVQSFKWRHGIKRIKTYCEAGSTDPHIVEVGRRQLQELLIELLKMFTISMKLHFSTE
jgi:hypothetical protein